MHERRISRLMQINKIAYALVCTYKFGAVTKGAAWNPLVDTTFMVGVLIISHSAAAVTAQVPLAMWLARTAGRHGEVTCGYRS